MAQERTLAGFPQVLRANGYRNGAFVSGWPLNGRLTHLNEWFDDYDEELTRRYQLFNSSRWAEDVTPRAVAWMKKAAAADRPFFLWVHYFDPHSPYDFREHFADLEKNGDAKPAVFADSEMQERIRNYDTEIAYMDWHMGKLFKALDELRLRDSTLVVLTADHGESLGEHDYVGHGRHLYENILRVPLIVRFPGRIKPATTISSPVSLLDIAPTVLDFTVQKTLEKNKAPLTFDGRSLASAMEEGAHLTERRLYSVTFPGKKGFAPRWLSWVWISNAELPLRFGLLEGVRKLIWSPEDDELAIYDISRDSAETNPRIVEKSARPYSTETRRLEAWFARTATKAAQRELSSRDIEVLRSLGYIQ